jgi:hypothetical protein
MSMSVTVYPCPICKGKPEIGSDCIRDYPFSVRKVFYIWCPNCRIKTFDGGSDEVISKWNDLSTKEAGR